MLETHLALIVAVIALIIAARRQRRVERSVTGARRGEYYSLELDQISADILYTRRIVVQSLDEKKNAQFFIDKEGRTVIDFPKEIVEGELIGNVSLRCGLGQGGFRVEFVTNPPDDLPRQFIALGFRPPQYIIETEPKLKWSPPEVLVFDADNTIVAHLP